MENSRFFLLILALAPIISSVLFDDIYSLSSIWFVCIVLYLAVDLIYDRKVKLVHAWLGVLVYSTISEGMVNYLRLEQMEYGLESVKYTSTANAVFLIGYTFSYKSLPQNEVSVAAESESIDAVPYYVAQVVAIVFYLVFGSFAANAFFKGRLAATQFEEESSFLFIASIMGILSSTYFALIMQKRTKRRFLRTLCFTNVLAISLMMGAGGTRFLCVYAMLPLLLSGFNYLQVNLKLSTFFGLFTGSMLGLFFLKLIRQFRGIGLSEASISFSSPTTTNPRFFEQIGHQFSVEGVLKVTAYIHDYTERNGFGEGQAAIFLFQMWIPRFIWPEKPTMLTYWIAREYESGFGTGHSVSAGLFGFLRYDFGPWAYLFALLIGYLLVKLELFVDLRRRKHTVAVCLLFPTVLFFVRSPITAVFYFCLIYGLHLIVAAVLSVYRPSFSHGDHR